jgi:hypothetical protein
VIGEQHHATEVGPSPDPRWLTITERGLYAGIAMFGAIGTGKTSACMQPFIEQLMAYRADVPEYKVGGLVLEVNGDFCRQVRETLERHGRADILAVAPRDRNLRSRTRFGGPLLKRGGRQDGCVSAPTYCVFSRRSSASAPSNPSFHSATYL